MAPPKYVKIISGAASTALFMIGLVNLIAPGSEVPYFPLYNNLNDFFWGPGNPKKLLPNQIAYSRVSGMHSMMIALTKFTVLFSNVDGTFLRRNLFITMGASQVAGSLLLVTVLEESAKAGGTSFWPHAIMLGGEGLLMLYDALMRDRPIKKKKN